MRPHVRPMVVLLGGLLLLLVAAAAGRSDLLGALLEPPPPASWVLAASGAAFGVWLLLRSASRVGARREPRGLIRGVRLAFLAVAAFAAAAGWAIGSPVPVVAAIVIAGVDVVETTFLLLVTARGEARGGTPSRG